MRRNILLFESSQALRRATTNILGHPDPDDVFTVDYLSAHRLTESRPVNVSNRLTATTRKLEHFVAMKVLQELGVQNVVTQPEDCDLEGGDFTFMPKAIAKTNGTNESLLVMGRGSQSRTNDKGRMWLRGLFSPDHHMVVETDQFHRDLVAAFLLTTNGQVAQVLLATEKVVNRDELMEQLEHLEIDIVHVPERIVGSCALNVSVGEGEIIGMQSFGKFEAELRRKLHPGVKYHVLPQRLQEATRGFTGLQGGANCVSGSILAAPGEIDSSSSNIQRINAVLHSDDFEQELRAHADNLDLRRKVDALRQTQQVK